MGWGGRLPVNPVGVQNRRSLHFEALSRLDGEAQQTVLNVIDGLMLKHQAQQWGARRPEQERSDAPATKWAVVPLVAGKNKKPKEKRPALAGR